MTVHAAAVAVVEANAAHYNAQEDWDKASGTKGRIENAKRVDILRVELNRCLAALEEAVLAEREEAEKAKAGRDAIAARHARADRLDGVSPAQKFALVWQGDVDGLPGSLDA